MDALAIAALNYTQLLQQHQQHHLQPPPPPHHPHTHWTDQLDDADLMLLSLGGTGDGAAVGDGASLPPLLFAGNWSVADGDGGNYTCASLEMSVIHRILVSFYAFVFSGGIVGNAMIIYTVLRGNGMQTVTNRYILNLAIADECFLIGMPFLIATMSIGDWVFGELACKAYMVSTSITQFTSSLFLLIMSADRYVAICHHISSPKYRTPNVSRLLSLLAWLTSALLIGPIIRYADVVDKGGGHFTCTVVWPDDRAIYGLSFTLYTLVFAFLLPLCFIVVFYGAVLLKLRRVSRRAQRSTKGSARHRKVTRLVLSVITVYICCWMPYWIGQVALILTPDRVCSSRLELMAFLATGCMGYLNSAINPVLYAYLSETFRKSLVRTVACLRWCGDSNDGGGGAGGGGGLTKEQQQQQQQQRRQRRGTDGDADSTDGTDGKGRGCRVNGGRLNDNGPMRGGKRTSGRSSDTQLTMGTTPGSGYGGGGGGGGGGNGYLESNTMTTVTCGLSSRNPSPPMMLRNSGGSGSGAADNNELLPLSTAA